MKKIWFLMIVFCACLFSACSSDKYLSGKVVEVSVSDDERDVVSCVIRTDEGKEIGLLVTDDTHIFSFVDGIDVQQFQTGVETQMAVEADYNGPRSSLVTQEGEKIPAYPAGHIELTGYRTEETVPVSGGVNGEVWRYDSFIVYALPDGTDLLKVYVPIGPGDVLAEGVENLKDLNETAQNSILTFFTNQGLGYDEKFELQKAYANYLKAEDPSKFTPSVFTDVR